MVKAHEYKPTLFDRHGPTAAEILRAFAYGLMVFGLTTGVLFLEAGLHVWSVLIGIAAGAAAGGVSWFLGELAGGAWKRVTVDGTSTPYREQYSYQQALVMKGEVDAALESYEAVIAEHPTAVDARIRAAELYIAERKNHLRAAELFREAQGIPGITTGEDVYVTNRLVDLLIGPLENPGRAMVELRRLIERYPSIPAAQQARTALAGLKARQSQAK